MLRIGCLYGVRLPRFAGTTVWSFAKSIRGIEEEDWLLLSFRVCSCGVLGRSLRSDTRIEGVFIQSRSPLHVL